MTKKEMETKAVDRLLEDGSIEIIYDIHSFDNEVDVIGTVGGDAVHYRVHFNGNEISSIGCK